MNTESKQLCAACRQAMIELYADTTEFDRLPAPEYSAEFLRFIETLKKRVRHNKYHKMTKTAKIILIAAILALLAAVSGFAARELRIYLIDHGNGSYLDVEKRVGTLTEDLSLGYVPEGFELTEENKSLHIQIKTYANSDNLFFVIQKQSSYSSIDIDSEGIVPKRTEINGVQYIISGSDNSTVIVWIPNDTKYLYTLSGNVEENELLKIAIHCK